MNKLLSFVSVSLFIVISACSQNQSEQANSNDKNVTKAQILGDIYSNIIQANADKAKSQCHALENKLAQKEASLNEVTPLFSNLVKQWKKLEAQYILGEFSSEAIDLPRFIDVYHVGNESLSKQISRAIKSSSKPSSSLFKHSQKTINALEIVLFNDSTLTSREHDLGLFISQNLCQRFDSIATLYKANKNAFLEDENKAAALLLNTLISSSYKLREWRVGDALGLSRKYKDEPDITRFEYEKSQQTIVAIAGILEAHSELMLASKQLNFADLIRKMGAQEALAQAQKHLEESNSLIQKVDSSTQLMQQGEPLYSALDKLHVSYYSSLVKSLDVVAKILEADGD